MIKSKSTKILLGINLTALVLFFVIWISVIFNSSFIIAIDSRIALVTSNLSTPALDQFMLIFAELTRPLSLFIFASIIAVILFFKKKWQEALFLIVATGGGALLKIFLKATIERPRPTNDYLALTDFSFPSGHATLSLIFFIALGYLFLPQIKSRGWRSFFIIFILVFILLIDLNRIYLNVHFASDVVGGIFLGAFWLTFTILMFKVYRSAIIPNRL